MQRRKTSASPASRRMSAAMAATRAAISSALKTGVMVDCDTRILHPHDVTFGAACAGIIGHLEALRDFHAGHPHDLILPEEQRQAIPDLDRDFTINQEILEFFRLAHAEGLEAIAGTAVADREGSIEGSVGGVGELERLPAVAAVREMHRLAEGSDDGGMLRGELELEGFDAFRLAAKDEHVIA